MEFNSFQLASTRSYFGAALEPFGIVPDTDLGVMTPGQSLSQLTSKLLVGLEEQFKIHRPDLVLGHGDTTTCFATAISSFYHQIPFFHVEAGLRTHRLLSPFPEEFNRQTVAPLARHHFAPTEIEKQNLLNDGIHESLITVIGSTVHEAVETIRARPIDKPNPILSMIGTRPLVVSTLHRREGIDSIDQTLYGLKLAAKERPNAIFVCPVHPNPKVKNAFHSILGNVSNIVLTEPLSYPDFIELLLRSQVVVTDSGGVQEEAAFLGKKVLLARSETERADGFHTGLVTLVGCKSQTVASSILANLSSSERNFDMKSLQHKTPASHLIAAAVERAIA